jgi:hypothetical protein
MEATCSPETLIDFQHNTRRYIPEESTPRVSQFGAVGASRQCISKPRVFFDNEILLCPREQVRAPFISPDRVGPHEQVVAIVTTAHAVTFPLYYCLQNMEFNRNSWFAQMFLVPGIQRKANLKILRVMEHEVLASAGAEA